MLRRPRVVLLALLLTALAGPAPARNAEAAQSTLERWVRTTFFPTARPAEHGARWDIAADANTRSHRYYRVLNEGPTVLMLIIVFLVVLKPF